MKYQDARPQEHPSAQTLSLLLGNDLPWTIRFRVKQHVRHCVECEREVTHFRSARSELKREASAEALTGFEAIADWKRLEREMLGNIGVGVAAARCVDGVARRRVLLWRGAFVTALVTLFLAGWMTHIPKEESSRVGAALRRAVGFERRETLTGTVVRSTPEGIAVRSQGATLTILHPPSAVVTLSGSSAVEARYVDEDTGQVTITNVYGQ